MPHDRLNTAQVIRIATGIADLEAFRITGTLTGEDLSALAQHVQGTFERSEEVDMLISFEVEDPEVIPTYNYNAADAGAMALKNLRNLAVVNAPGYIHALLDAVDKVVPVAIRSFHSEAEALSWLSDAGGGRL